MKKILLLTLALTLSAFTSSAMADDTTTISIKKAGDSTAKVTTWPGDKNETVVPIKFDDGADWTTVKDSYDVAPDTAKAIQAKTLSISVGSDGGVSFHKTSKSAKPASTKKK